MTIFTNNSYPYKHWLTSLAAGALILLVVDVISGINSLNDAIGICTLVIIFGFFFSLPVFILYLLLFNLLIHKLASKFLIKTILNAVTILGVFITIKLISGTMMTPKLALYYSCVLLVCSSIFKIKKQNTTDT